MKSKAQKNLTRLTLNHNEITEAKAICNASDEPFHFAFASLLLRLAALELLRSQSEPFTPKDIHLSRPSCEELVFTPALLTILDSK